MRNAELGHPRRRSHHGRWWIAPVALLLIGACGGGSPAVDTEDGLTVPREAVHVVGTAEILTGVRDLQPADDGRVWVLNALEAEPHFVVLGPEGLVEREFGHAGGGPTEFGAPMALVRDPDRGEIWTFDFSRQALIRLSTEERLDLPLPRDSLLPLQTVTFDGAGGLMPTRLWLEARSDGFLLARNRRGGPPPLTALALWNADILLLRPDSSSVSLEVYTPVADLLGDPASRYPGATRFLPYPLWTVCADGTVGLYDPLENKLRRIPENGRALEPLTLPEERRLQFTAERFFEMAYREMAESVPAGQRPDSAELRRRLVGEFDQFESESASVFPEYADLRCTPDGTLWLQPFDVSTGRMGRGPAWYRISTDGSRTTVTLPEEFRPFRFEADRIWGTVHDEFGIESVAWIGVGALR